MTIQDVDGEKVDIGKNVQLFHKQLLQLAMENGSNREYAILYDIQNGNVYTIEGGEWYITLPDELEEELDNASPGTFVVLHNHPNNSLFSFIDIRSFIAHESLYAISVIGHNGDVHVLTKNKQLVVAEDVGKVLLEYLDRFEHKTIQQFLIEAENFGLTYRYEVNMKL